MSNMTPLSEKVSAYYLELYAAAGTLNQVSDALGNSISEIDEGLRKLNLGITAWVEIDQITSGRTPVIVGKTEEIGYAKVGGKWGIALRTRARNLLDLTSQEETESWPFSEAPRSLRIKSLEKIPDLLRALTEEATTAADEYKTKLADVQSIATALSPRRSLAEGFTAVQNSVREASQLTRQKGIEIVAARGDQQFTGLVSELAEYSQSETSTKTHPGGKK